VDIINCWTKIKRSIQTKMVYRNKHVIKGVCNKNFQNELVFEKYLSLLSPKYIYVFSKYRCSSHWLPV
jgi:hypothetical protein